MEKIEDLENRIESLEKEIARYKGFIGGAVFIVSCLWAVIMLLKDRLF